MGYSPAARRRAAQNVVECTGIGGIPFDLTNRPDRAAPRPIVHATYSIAIPAARVIQPTDVIQPGPREITCATIVSADIATIPSSTSATSDEDVAMLLQRRRAPRHAATAANPPGHAKAPSPSDSRITPSSGIPTMEKTSPMTSAMRTGMNRISAAAPSSPELNTDEARTPIDRIQPGATTVSNSETINTRLRRSTVADNAASGHHPRQLPIGQAPHST